jgi:hypothetical protein
MKRMVPAALAAALLGLASAAGSAAPPLVLAQGQGPGQGWWEQEHQEQPSRERYWRLPRPQADRYNRLQFEINKLLQQRQSIDQRIAEAQREQHSLLGFPPR